MDIGKKIKQLRKSAKLTQVELAERVSAYDVLCYVNADIILMSDFTEAIQRVQKRPFLLIGQRVDVDINGQWDFTDLSWEARLRAYAARRGTPHSPKGIDYFVFRRGLYRDVPAFAIGRTVWDNWLVYRARSLGVRVIDATATVTAIHQNHDFSHHRQGRKGVRHGLEAKRNRELAGAASKPLGVFDLHDATWILTKNGLRPALTIRHLKRRIDKLPVLYPRIARLAPLAKRALYLARM